MPVSRAISVTGTPRSSSPAPLYRIEATDSSLARRSRFRCSRRSSSSQPSMPDDHTQRPVRPTAATLGEEEEGDSQDQVDRDELGALDPVRAPVEGDVGGDEGTDPD